MSLEYLPSVRGSGIVVGSAFSLLSSQIVYGPLLGSIWSKAMQQDKNSEFWKREAGPVAATYASSVAAAVAQAYGVGALINVTGTLSYKGAAYLGALLLLVNTAPSAVHSIFVEKRPTEFVAVKAVSQVLETVGLSLVLTWWGTRSVSSPF